MTRTVAHSIRFLVSSGPGPAVGARGARRGRAWLATVTLLGALVVPSTGWAQSAPATQDASALSDNFQQARRFVQTKHDELYRAVKAAKDPRTDPALLAIFDSMLDYDALTKDSLGSEWSSLNPEQQAEFGRVLKQLVQKSYRKNLRDPSDYVVQYAGESAAGEGTLVKTLAQNKANKREKPLGIDYVVGSAGGQLKVRDVITDGVSLVRNYRSQFKRIIKKKGVDGLLEQMRKQLDK